MQHTINAQPKFTGDINLFAGWPEFLYVTQPLVFTWHDETGEVSGPSAELVREIAQGEAKYGPPPGGMWTFSAGALKSRAEMAVLIASEWELPAELRDDFPLYETPFPALP
jgi:hypothetical protein